MGRRPKIQTLETRITALQVEVSMLKGRLDHSRVTTKSLEESRERIMTERDRLQAQVAARDIALSQSETLRKECESALLVEERINTFLRKQLAASVR